jgi:nucleotide-binding universal stress UspA family protein
MTYKTLMVHLELQKNNDTLLNFVGDLAERFQAHVIGIAACQPVQMLYDEGFTAGDVMVQDRAEITKEMAAAESQFRKALAGRAPSLEWCHTVTAAPLASYIAEQASAADLLITGPDLGPSLLDNTRRVNLGNLVMEAGRPVLIVPHGVSTVDFQRTVIGWKGSREARRAVSDALPVLEVSEHVTVLEVATRDGLERAHAHVKDVSRWLGRHGVEAVPSAILASGPEVSALHDELLERRCSLFIAGAYGHSRGREFVFGGITYDMLLEAEFCVLISH